MSSEIKFINPGRSFFWGCKRKPKQNLFSCKKHFLDSNRAFLSLCITVLAFFTIDCCICEGETLMNKRSILNNLLAVIPVIRKLHRTLHVASSCSLGDCRHTFCEPQQRADFPQMVWMTSLYPICHIDWIRIGIVKMGGAKVTMGLSLPPGWWADQLFFWRVIAPV